MKARQFLCSCVILFLAVAFSTYAEETYVVNPNEEIYGTWTNPKMEMQKNECFLDGSKDYIKISDTTPMFESKAQLVSKWKDASGNIWYKRFGTIIAGDYKGTMWQSLERISKSGTVREWVSKIVTEFASGNYPTSIDPKDQNYRIYFRTKS